MRIAFEASSITTHKPTGIAVYAMSLIEELIAIGDDRHQLVLLNKLSRWKRRQQMYRHSALPAHFYLPLLSGLLHQIDILHALDAYIPAWPGAAKIVTVHDLFVYVKQDAEFFPASFVRRKHASYRNVARRSDAIIAVSESTRDDIVQYLNFPQERTFVTPLGIDAQYYRRDPDEVERVKRKYGLTADYLLFVGNITSRKNTTRIVQAYHAAGLSADLALVMCGAQSYNSDSTVAEIQRLKLQSRVTLLNYVDKADLPALYSGARGFVYPTLYEGFGIPPLEAMACGTPVLSSNTGSAPGVCGEHAILVDPYNVDAIADGMQKLLKTTREAIAAAKAHAATFSWRRCAEQTLAVYRQIGKT